MVVIVIIFIHSIEQGNLQKVIQQIETTKLPAAPRHTSLYLKLIFSKYPFRYWNLESILNEILESCFNFECDIETRLVARQSANCWINKPRCWVWIRYSSSSFIHLDHLNWIHLWNSRKRAWRSLLSLSHREPECLPLSRYSLLL